ncbi:membrane-bound lytic murein transglycosylase D [Pseudoalteromonas ulvae UL12]|uniref:LysM peptidoglycan-binding domain-containing protein n=1 Tax=Pseudoalteromonas ulvae TaxID=107327 RepID=UPI00186B7A72|nr:LysM peptidoglycan-binding domain-containing protein [Pseudoalteromonas ulvae]MBE0364953.1 membrane-bound lytic murein transglycosylase D [Pseudoalteromonas ulvae UL12]
MTQLLYMRNTLTLTLCFISLVACQSTESSHDAAFVAAEPILVPKKAIVLEQPMTSAPQASLPASAPKPIKAVAPKIKTLQPYEVTNLWQRITMQFTLPVPNNSIIKKRINWYRQHPNYMDTISARAQPFFYHIVKEIERRKLPLELALLPIVESDFNTKAYSSEGAAGIWQLMPETAKHFKLNREAWYDGRLDTQLSTHAALDYLEYLYERFNQDWLLAIAAYNSGESRVLAAIKKNRKAKKSTDFWSLKLPKETTNYVPRLFALVEIAKKEGTKKWPVIANKANTVTVDIGQQFDMLIAAKLTKTDMKTLYQLNPAILGEKSAKHGPFTLQIPIEKARYFDQRYVHHSEILGLDHYQVQKKDSLYQLAKRFKTTVNQLKDLNQLNSDVIKIGQTLKLPALEPIPLTINYQISPFIMRSAPPEKIKVSVNYIVKPGDTLWKISRLYHVSHRELAEWNQLNSQAALKLGKKLTIWLEQTPSVPIEDSPSQNSLLTNPTLLLQKVTSINPI